MTWRVVASTTTVVIAWLVTGSLGVGAVVGGYEFFAKMVLYYLHERVWYNFIGFGVSAVQTE